MSGLNERTVPQLVKKGVARVPLVMQMESLECGAAALAMIMHYFRKWIPLAQVRVDCGISMNGSNAKNILRAARNYGMAARAWRVEPESLLAEGPFPCILHWGFNHFVVLCGFQGRRAVINDPARGCIRVEWDEFDRQFTGVCLIFFPGEDFVPSGSPRSFLYYAKEHLRGCRRAVLFLMLITAVSSLLGLIKPLFVRVFLDRLLTGQNPEWLQPFMMLFVLFALVCLAVSWITAIFSLRLQGALDARGSSAYLRKVLRLPTQFFDQRLSADIADRQAASAEIADTLVKICAPLAVQSVTMAVCLAVMIRYSPMLSLISAGAFLLNLLVSAAAAVRRVNITRVQQLEGAKLSAAAVSGITMIETIKAGGAENAFFARWAGYQAGVNTQSVSYTLMNHVTGAVLRLITTTANLAVLGIGVMLVLRGWFTAGMVIAFQGFLSVFMGPAFSLIAAGQTMQEMIGKMERLDDVMSHEEDPVFAAGEKKSGKEKLSGLIELKHVTFGYTPFEKPVISDFSMTVKPGQKIAVFGRTGCGKTTLARLIAGLYLPWSGTISFDSMLPQEIDRGLFAGSVSFIDQDTVFFEDTIAQNIRLWDDSIEDSEMERAARDAGIYDEIAAREGGFQHVLQAGGKEFSGGQRQCLEIARALCCQPGIVIMDEATSALDVQTESKIMRAVRARGITLIVIAHRLSAIRDCDKIIVLDEGHAVEQGTHEELISRGGVYAALAGREQKAGGDR